MSDLEIQILQYFQTIGWAGVAALFVWKVLAPLTRSYIGKRNGGPGDVSAEIQKIKHNDLHEIKADIKNLQNDIGKLSERMAVVETRQKNHINHQSA